jgi:hypothetical protein
MLDVNGPRHFSLHIDSLRVLMIGVRVHVGAGFFASPPRPDRLISNAYRWFYPRGLFHLSMDWTVHLYLAPKSIMRGDIPPFSRRVGWCRGDMANSYSEGDQFEPGTWHRLSWPKYFLEFIRSLAQIIWQYLDYDKAISFQIISNLFLINHSNIKLCVFSIQHRDPEAMLLHVSSNIGHNDVVCN